ncbi:MAG: SH3 domain-containing protein [Chloroflexota bacterium]|nr:SH3 domain-containing protein [Dehalococcoidia bacterium]MDW8047385.1 SH3 domain-containing protein [Chloroflexota bacterium]
MAAEQRFCPVCDEAFIEGDAVLRCAGCGVLYHPRCWVREDGCPAPGEHDRTPIALAYSIAAPGPRPTVTSPPVISSSPGPDLSGSDDVIIGAESPPPGGPHDRTAAPRPQPPTVPYAAGSRQPRGRRTPNLAVYERHRWARYWFVPAAAALAALTALAVIVVGERLLGSDAEPAATPAPTASTGQTASSPAGEPATPSGSSPTPAATPSGRFAVGQRLIVTGTGECLNVRVQPGLQSDVVACIPDGTEVEVRGGPREADGYRWWQLATPQGNGWAVESYLAPAP